MGLDIDRVHFEPEEYGRYTARLHENLKALAELLLFWLIAVKIMF